MSTLYQNSFFNFYELSKYKVEGQLIRFLHVPIKNLLNCAVICSILQYLAVFFRKMQYFAVKL
jgi:hypothetical protein